LWLITRFKSKWRVCCFKSRIMMCLAYPFSYLMRFCVCHAYPLSYLMTFCVCHALVSSYTSSLYMYMFKYIYIYIYVYLLKSNFFPLFSLGISILFFREPKKTKKESYKFEIIISFWRIYMSIHITHTHEYIYKI